jgi:ABC-2 type transport system ATP-binding protein
LTNGVLRAVRLAKRYHGVAVVRDVDFAVCPGEVLGYLGPNGSGKTTTLRMLTGFLDPSAGHAEFEGTDVRDHPIAFRRRLGYIPEEPLLYPFLSGREYLELVGRLRGLADRRLASRIDGFLDLFGILAAADQSIASYSKGMRQKVLITAALLHDPALIVFDEPESGLDVTSTLVLRHLVRTLAERGKTIVYSSHLLEVVERVCTRVIVIHRGAVVADDSVAHLRERMASDSLEAVFAQLAMTQNPEHVARDLADLTTAGA